MHSTDVRTMVAQPGWRWLPAAGWLSLAAAAASVIVLPAGWLSIALAGVATVGLAADRRLGWLPAALLVTIALPYGRGADVAPLTVGGLPIRPQDMAIGLALLVTAFTLDGSRIRAVVADPGGRRTLIVAVALFLAVGLLAMTIGILGNQQLRDIFRDVRWWFLYGVAALAVLAVVRRTALLRALMIGTAAFTVIVFLVALLPAFEGGLKSAAVSYDAGTMRLQYGNSIYLLPALAYATWVASRRFNLIALVLVFGLFGAQVLSLTRTSLLVSLGVVLAILAWRLVSRRPRRIDVRRLLAGAAVLAALAVGFVGALTANGIGTPRTAADAGAVPQYWNPEDPFARLTFGDTQSDINVIVTGGRFSTYVNALNEIAPRPVLGGGMGQLVDVAFAYNLDRAHTLHRQPGVDNAALTVGLKAGVVGVAAFGALLLLPLLAALRPLRRHLRGWFIPAWLGVLALTISQSFAVTGYGPYGVGLLIALPFLGYAASRTAAARSQR